jgi:hypothetical protein
LEEELGEVWMEVEDKRRKDILLDFGEDSGRRP